jgi:hypothetical protein
MNYRQKSFMRSTPGERNDKKLYCQKNKKQKFKCHFIGHFIGGSGYQTH